jgi:hypothetical protein
LAAAISVLDGWKKRPIPQARPTRAISITVKERQFETAGDPKPENRKQPIDLQVV